MLLWDLSHGVEPQCPEAPVIQWQSSLATPRPDILQPKSGWPTWSMPGKFTRVNPEDRAWVWQLFSLFKPHLCPWCQGKKKKKRPINPLTYLLNYYGVCVPTELRTTLFAKEKTKMNQPWLSNLDRFSHIKCFIIAINKIHEQAMGLQFKM